VGKSGRIICVDVQERMLDKLKKRAQRSGLLDRITAILTDGNSLHIEKYEGQIDFALAFAVVHEVPEQRQMFDEVYHSMKDGSLLLISEPEARVAKEDFQNTVEIARERGFREEASLDIRRSRSVLLKRI
jgi:predicted O-methyltransferase YrrM